MLTGYTNMGTHPLPGYLALRSALITWWFFLLGVCLTPVAAANAGGEIYCACNGARYDTPRECMENCCPETHFRLQCRLDPTCGPHKDDLTFKQLYNVALFDIPIVKPFTGSLGPYGIVFLQRGTVAHIINNYYKPHNARELNIDIGPVPHPEGGRAAVTKPDKGKKKYNLIVTNELFFDQSPAMLIQGIGSEMVHFSQLKREGKWEIDPRINEVIDALWELEATTWEMGGTDFPWEIGSNKFFNCLLESEKENVNERLRASEKQVKKAIGTITWSSTLCGALNNYLEKNPWTKTVWLPKNPDWRTWK